MRLAGRLPLLALPSSQLMALALSVLASSILAQRLGPAPFAHFAGFLFVFTVSSLLTDLAPQSFLLVRGYNSDTLRAARRIARKTGGASAAALAVGLTMYSEVSGYAYLTASWLLLGTTATLTQSLAQPSKAVLLLKRRYWASGIVEVAAVAVGAVVAFASVRDPGLRHVALATQLSAVMISRWALLIGLTWNTREPVGIGADLEGDCVRFGLQVMPLSLAGFLGRTLDSGLMPTLLGAGASGTYARCSQLIVTPVNQAQLSLGGVILSKLGASARLGRRPNDRLMKRAWMLATLLSVSLGIVISALAIPISTLFFGPLWPAAPDCIRAMATTLPSMAWCAYFALVAQTFPSKASIRQHFVVLLIGPLSALLGAHIQGGLTGALLGLVIGAGVLQPTILLVVHRTRTPWPAVALVPSVILAWVPLSLLFHLAR
jgi:hypothetical protein